MASGDTLCVVGDPRAACLPATSYPQFSTRNVRPTLNYAIGEEAFFEFIMPRHYDGGGVTVYLHYAMSAATSGNVTLETRFERIGDGQQDLDSDGFASGKDTGDVAVPSTSGHVDIASVSHSDGAEMDSVAVGEKFRLGVKRVAASTSDATGDLELVGIEIVES